MGPLSGMRVIEIEGLGPAPFCGMMLADMGAEVISICRKSDDNERTAEISERGKRSIAVNLKSKDGVEIVLKLVESADAFIEGFRPGVTERLGIGPDECLARNPRLVYGRMTGWGQTGPLAKVAGHDLNYISISGALHAIGRDGQKPSVPLNLIGDMGGGGMFLAFGVMCAIYEAASSGKGQVVDASMVEGTGALMHKLYAMKAMGQWEDRRECNLVDGGAHFYDTYETKDGLYVSIGSIEPQFYELLITLTGLDRDEFSAQMDKRQWPLLKSKVEAVMKTKTRAEWVEIMEGTEVCFAPILSMSEAPDHPHNKARNSFVEIDGTVHPAPAPKFSRTQPQTPESAKPAGSDAETVLKELGYCDADIAALRTDGALA